MMRNRKSMIRALIRASSEASGSLRRRRAGRPADPVWDAYMTLEIQTGGRRRCRCRHCLQLLQEFDKLCNTTAQQTHVLNCKDNPYKLKLAKDIAHGVSAPMLGTIGRNGGALCGEAGCCDGYGCARHVAATGDFPLHACAQSRCPRGYPTTSTAASYNSLPLRVSPPP
ncbi:unnamed protein product [Phaeothamnion confervicola]